MHGAISLYTQPIAVTCFLCSGLFGMGVADGVYAWRNQDIDSGELSRALMLKAREMIEGGMEDSFQGGRAANLHGKLEWCGVWLPLIVGAAGVVAQCQGDDQSRHGALV